MDDARRFAALLLLLFAAGCGGPTRTAGTRGVDAADLSVFSVAQLPRESPVQIRTIRFDGAGPAYKVGNGRDFYLPPRDHTASFTLEARLPKIGGGIAGLFIPKRDLTFPGPRAVPLGTLAAGKTYELIRPAEDFADLLQSGRLALVREKED